MCGTYKNDHKKLKILCLELENHLYICSKLRQAGIKLHSLPVVVYPFQETTCLHYSSSPQINPQTLLLNYRRNNSFSWLAIIVD